MDKPCLPDDRQVAFMPWLRLRQSYQVAGVTFMPWRTELGTISPEIADAAEAFSVIFGSYVDLNGNPIDNCVLATLPERGWHLVDSDFEVIRSAAALLFLAAWSSNEYFRSGAPYVNASAFRPVWQCFSGSPERFTLVSRRRDGAREAHGYRHGKALFSLPIQCTPREPAEIDDAFLSALDACNAAGCSTLDRVRRSLPFVLLANTDDSLMSFDAESILMGSAFEQLFGIGIHVKKKAFELSSQFGELMKGYGSVTVEDAMAVRTRITTDPKFATEQSRWFVHQKWMQEFYQIRNDSVHDGSAHAESSGWSSVEHLVLAALAFPLVIKLLLCGDKVYNFSEDDHARCLAVDQLLATTGWSEHPGEESKWNRVMSEARREYLRRQIADELRVAVQGRGEP